MMNRKQRRAQRIALTFKFDKGTAKFHRMLARAAVRFEPQDYTHITPAKFHGKV